MGRPSTPTVGPPSERWAVITAVDVYSAVMVGNRPESTGLDEQAIRSDALLRRRKRATTGIVQTDHPPRCHCRLICTGELCGRNRSLVDPAIREPRRSGGTVALAERGGTAKWPGGQRNLLRRGTRYQRHPRGCTTVGVVAVPFSQRPTAIQDLEKEGGVDIPGP